ncbi:MAG TPA: alpha/beta hydrolase [Terriglobales bacterium]|nr:alpha/beta hydrolase [Terriglobales bacterium]
MTVIPILARIILLTSLAGSAAVSALGAEKVVDISAPDGLKLKATYFSAKKPGPGVLLLHQCNRQRKVWDELGRQLAAAGINVLTLDYRGYGESGGDRFDKLPPQQAGRMQRDVWPSDIDAAFQFLQSQPGVKRDLIGAGGASCGVQNSIQLARRHLEVKSLVLLSGPANGESRQFLRDAKHLPVFFAVADDDEFADSIVAIQWLYSLDASPGKRFIHYATGGHGADMFAVRPDLIGQIVDWYVMTLISTPGEAPIQKNAPVGPEQIQNLSAIDEPGGAARISRQMEESRRTDPNATLFPEQAVNLIGYEHLQAGDNTGAIEIFKLNAAAYPESPNVYDSLSDAYLAAGEKLLARLTAEKALQLLSSDTKDPEQLRNGIRESAEGKLRQLGKTEN